MSDLPPEVRDLPAEVRDLLGNVAAEKVLGRPAGSVSPKELGTDSRIAQVREHLLAETRRRMQKDGLSPAEAGRAVRDSVLPDWSSAALALDAAELASRDPSNPWRSRPGWAVEPELPVVKHQEGKLAGDALEPAIEVYNKLVREAGFRPFRTSDGEAWVAVPSPGGVDVIDISDPSKADRFAEPVGYMLYTMEGKPVPWRDLREVFLMMRGRALSRDLPTERVIRLEIRVAPVGPFESRLDLADARRRTVRVGPEGWSIENVSAPVFRRPRHLQPLPEPVRSSGSVAARLEGFWAFARVKPGEPGGSNPRLLVLTALVLWVLVPRATQRIVVVPGEEDSGKTATDRFLGRLLDPSLTQAVPPPADSEEMKEIARNRGQLHFDNVSSIRSWLADDICRLTSGIALPKRKLYTDSDEVLVQRWMLVVLNGITATPHQPDVLRRTVFAPNVPLGDEERKPEAELEAAWDLAHPTFLGAFLDVCVGVAGRLRDGNASKGGDFESVGRAVAEVLGLSGGDFDLALRANTIERSAAAVEDPLTAALVDFWRQRAPDAEPVSSGGICTWVLLNRAEAFPRKDLTPKAVGEGLRRARKTMSLLGLDVRSKLGHNNSQLYFLGKEEMLPPVPPGPSLEHFSDGTTAGGPAGGPRGDPVEVPPRPGGDPAGVPPRPAAVPPRRHRREKTPRGGAGGPGGGV